ncbi:ASKHA domain-containing protein [Desulfurispora thermophila]|uniref:ASKHA domain-containing protein n=1 Tax=Desulfurispora thermophila TaxID=265470 RepID=UPI001FA81758|nr:ASKHA domain-containing protein [Desulfurispora thermophila]
MVTVEFEPVGRRVEVEPGRTVLQAARDVLSLDAGGVNAPCGGKGLCGRCRVRLVQGELSPPGELERRMLGPRELADGYRLACQALILGPVKVEIPPETLAGRQSLQVAGTAEEIALEPVIKRYHIPLQATTVDFPFSTWQQVEVYLRQNYGMEDISIDSVLFSQVETLAGNDHLTVSLRGREIINAFWTAGSRKPLGLAVDLGTTKMAGFLLDLETGSTLAADGILNPQIAYGEDVMSRLAYALEGAEQYSRITRVLVEGLDRLLQTLCSQAGARPEDVEEAVIVGNTAMHHLLLGLPVGQLARSPYVPALTLPLEVKARQLGLGMAGGAVVYLVPAVAGFVGGDHVAMILSSRIQEAPGVTLGLDIGTNTEIVLARSGEMISCSCASGPAFEGAHIQQGMRAIDGAVSKVSVTSGGREVHCETIGGKAPVGICGSGILDAVAGLYRAGVISASGRLDTGHPRVRWSSDRKTAEYVLVPAGENGAGRDIVVTQKDISEIQLAKAAIAAGIQVLLAQTGLQYTDIDRVVVAGAFGTHLQLESAIAIGMLPHLPLQRYQQVGNAAGAGARMILLSAAERRRAVEIARNIKYIELAARAEFNSIYLSQIRFPG